MIITFFSNVKVKPKAFFSCFSNASAALCSEPLIVVASPPIDEKDFILFVWDPNGLTLVVCLVGWPEFTGSVMDCLICKLEICCVPFFVFCSNDISLCLFYFESNKIIFLNIDN
jgi:hypothetical protein